MKSKRKSPPTGDRTQEASREQLERALHDRREEAVVIAGWPLGKTDPETVFAGARADADLVAALSDYIRRELAPKDIEVFRRLHNIAATEKGYIGAFYAREIRAVRKTK